MKIFKYFTFAISLMFVSSCAYPNGVYIPIDYAEPNYTYETVTYVDSHCGRHYSRHRYNNHHSRNHIHGSIVIGGHRRGTSVVIGVNNYRRHSPHNYSYSYRPRCYERRSTQDHRVIDGYYIHYTYHGVKHRIYSPTMPRNGMIRIED